MPFFFVFGLLAFLTIRGFGLLGFGVLRSGLGFRLGLDFGLLVIWRSIMLVAIVKKAVTPEGPLLEAWLQGLCYMLLPSYR